MQFGDARVGVARVGVGRGARARALARSAALLGGAVRAGAASPGAPRAAPAPRSRRAPRAPLAPAAAERAGAPDALDRRPPGPLARDRLARADRGGAARGRGAAAALAAARLLAPPQGRQGQVLQEEGLRAAALDLRARVPQHVLADAARQRGRVPPVRRVPGRAQRVAHRARRAAAGGARPRAADARDALPAVVRGARGAGRGAQPRVQVRVERQVGQPPRRGAAAVPARLRAARGGAPPGARRGVAGGGALRPRHQQPARALRPGAAPRRAPRAPALQVRGLREGSRLPARGPVGAARGVDRDDPAARRGEDLLLPPAGAPEHHEGAEPLRAARLRRGHADHAARRPAEPAGPAAHVPQEEDDAQASDGADPVQRLPVPAHVPVPLARAARHRRGDRAAGGPRLAGADGARAAAGDARRRQAAALLVPRLQRVLPGLAGPLPRVGARGAALPAHAAARVPHPQLHEARPVREGVPRDGPRARAAQPLPAGVPRRRVLVVRAGDAARAAAALPRGLRVRAVQGVRGAARGAGARRGAVALARPDRDPRDRHAAGARLPAAPAPVTATGAPSSAPSFNIVFTSIFIVRLLFYFYP